MTTTPQTNAGPLSTVIGVFSTHDQADQAIDALRQTNFRYDHIRVVERGTGGFGDTLKGLFTGQAAMASNAADNLVKMGMPDYEAQYYQHELDTDHVLVLMNADDRPEEAFSVMRQNGAFDIQLRLRLSPTDDTTSPADDTLTRRDAQEAQAVTQQPQPQPQQPQPQPPVTPATPPPLPQDDPRYYANGSQNAYNSAAAAANAPTDPNLPPQRADQTAPQNA